MSLPSLSILTLSLRSLLASRLQKALQLQQGLLPLPEAVLPTASVSTGSTERFSAAAPSEISLNRFKQASPIRYVSAIAFRLARQLQAGASSLGSGLPAASVEEMQIEIAQIFVNRLNQLAAADLALKTPDLSAWVWQNCQAQVAEPGWIYLELADRGVAMWLQALIDQQMHSGSFATSQAEQPERLFSSTPDLRNSTKIFSLLYTHARCCSLLHLADQTGLIRLDRARAAASRSDLAVLAPLPWQNDRCRLRCQHPTELQLISQIVNGLDKLAELETDDRSQPYSKLAHSLSQDFQSFYAACPIWGMARDDLPLAQVRLGLVLITQKLMKLLLAGMGIEAPAEL